VELQMQSILVADLLSLDWGHGIWTEILQMFVENLCLTKIQQFVYIHIVQPDAAEGKHTFFEI
jgi:hypothetical protein